MTDTLKKAAHATQVARAHVEDAAFDLEEFRQLGVNAYGILMNPHAQLRALRAAYDDLAKAIGALESTDWPTIGSTCSLTLGFNSRLPHTTTAAVARTVSDIREKATVWVRATIMAASAARLRLRSMTMRHVFECRHELAPDTAR